MTLKDYLQTQIDLIPEASEITSSTVNSDPKIIFVNGHWNKIIPGPSEAGRNYWNSGAFNGFSTAAATFFGLTGSPYEKKWVDGADWVYGSATVRKAKGHLWAQTHYSDLTSQHNGTLDFYLIGHSQGCAYAAGIADYLKFQKHNIISMLFLSCHQGDKFSVDSTFNTYQMVYSFWKYEPVTYRSTVYKWRHHVDLFVGDHKVNGATKYGVITRNDLGFMTVHGTSTSSTVFNKIKDLQDVSLVLNIRSNSTTYYSQSSVNNGTEFYSVDKVHVEANDPDFNP